MWWDKDKMWNEIIVRQIIFKGRKELLMIGLSHPISTHCLARILLQTSQWRIRWLNRSKETQENIMTLISNWNRPITQVTCSLVTNSMERKRRKKASIKIKEKEPPKTSFGRGQLQSLKTPATDSITHQTSRSDSAVYSMKCISLINCSFDAFYGSMLKVIHISMPVVPLLNCPLILA